MTGTARLVRQDRPTAGEPLELTRTFTLLGHHHTCDIPFHDPHAVGVSDRHAAIIQSGAQWLLRDLHSTEGTWVNDSKIGSDVALQSGDVIRFGRSGPEVRFETTHAGATTRPWRGTRRSWMTTAILIVVTTGAVMAWQARRGLEASERVRATLLARVDSLAGELRAAQTRPTRLSAPLRTATGEATSTRAALAAAPARPSARLDSLAAAVQELAARQAPLLRAANLDLAVMATGNQDAVALVLAERADGSVVSGTGFALRRSGDTSWVVTSRHVVLDSTGTGAIRLGVVFHGTAQNFRASLERVHPTADLALLRLVVRGGTPVVRGLEEHVSAGLPVGTITFPGELDVAPTATWRTLGVTARTLRATIIAVDPDRLQLDGYGVEGMSGSPIFTAAGLVAGVIFGGPPGAGGRIVFAVPGTRVRELLDGG